MATNRTRPICLPSILLPMLLVVVLLLLDTPLCADAQPPAPTDDDMFETYNTNSSSSTAILIAFLICAFFFVGVFSVYFHRCAGNSSAISASAARGAVGRAAGRGLDPAMLESFPTMEYAAVKKVKGGQFGTLECAVCLAEFLEDDTLRLLPKCRHVFHPDCIDAWLASHVTCPVCRSNLGNAEEVAVTTDGGVPVPPDHVEIDIEGEDRGPDEADLELTARPKPPPETFRRWHSEGRSAEGGQDRHTLRLPEHVQRELAAPGSFRRSQSMTGYPDGGEAGSRGGIRGGGGRSGRMGRSEPWMSFLRVFPVAGDRLDGAVRAGGVDSGSTTDGDKSTCTAGVEPV